jgi:hypothetical protein
MCFKTTKVYSHSDLLSLTSPKGEIIQMVHWCSAHEASWGEVGVLTGHCEWTLVEWSDKS